MNVKLPKKTKFSTKAIIIYTISIITCIIAIIIAGLSFYYGSDELDRLITIGGSSLTSAEEKYQLLESNFDDIFQNRLEEYTTNANIKKVDDELELVYTYYEKNEIQENSYEINLHIPYINIDNDIIKKYNEEIKRTYEAKAESTLQTQNENIIYTLQYEATIEDNILSLIIKSNLKEGSRAQRLIVQTFNYDLKNNKEISLAEMLELKSLDEKTVQSKIDDKIQTEQKRVNDLRSLGYGIFERNSDDEIYKIENSQEFFVKNGIIYIIYAYGNENITSEIDLVII